MPLAPSRHLAYTSGAGERTMQDQPSPPIDTEAVDRRIAESTPERVTRAIFAAVEPPVPSKQRPAAERKPATP